MVKGSCYLPEQWKKNKSNLAGHLLKSLECPIWGKILPNESQGYQSGDKFYYWSPRGGGAFSFSASVVKAVSAYVKTERDKIVFSRWIFDQNYEGYAPKIHSIEHIKDILRIDDISIDAKLTRLLVLHDIMSERPSIGLWSSGHLIEGARDVRNLCLAGANVANIVDYSWLLSAAVKEEVLEFHTHHSCKYLRLSPKGLGEMREKNSELSSKQAFVAMWFDEKVDSAYDNSILPAIRATGHTAYRVDRDNSHSDQITNKILAEIKRSKFLIADFTHGLDGARGGVYFEAGYALGLGIPVLWLIRKDGVSKMHFDTNHYPHIVWKNENQLKEQLESAILAHQHIGIGAS